MKAHIFRFSSPKAETENKTSLVFIIVILLLGAGLRFYDLGGKSMWDDEVITVQIAQKDLRHIGQELGQIPNNPALHYWLVHFFLKLGSGNDEFWARLPSALFGIAAIPFLYLLTRALFGKKSALVAIALLAFSPLHIYYSQEARAYTQFTFFSLLSFYFFFEILRQDSRKWEVGYVLSSTLSLYTHYFAIFYLLAQVVIVLLFFGLEKRKVRWGLRFPALWALIVLLCIPIARLVLAQQRLLSGPGMSIGDWTAPLIAERVKLSWPVLLSLAGAQNQIPIALLLLGMFGFGLYSVLRRHAKLALFLLIWLVVPFLGGMAVLEKRWFFHVRYFIPMTIPFIVVAAVGIHRVVRLFSLVIFRLDLKYGDSCTKNAKTDNQIIMTILASLLVVSIFWPSLAAYYKTEKQNLKGAKEYVKGHMLPGDSIVLTGLALPWLQYYFEDLGPAIRTPETTDALEALSQPGRRVWFVYGWGFTSPQGYPEIFNWSQKAATQHITLPGEIPVKILFWGPDDESVLREGLAQSLGQFNKNLAEVDAGLMAGNSFLTLGLWQDAIDVYQRVGTVLWADLERDPDNLDARRKLTALLLGSGEAQDRMNNWPESARYYNDALAIDPSTMSRRGDFFFVFEHYFQGEYTGVQDLLKESNLLSNPDFEEGSTGWNAYRPEFADPAAAEFAVEDEDCFEGKNCLLVRGLTPSNHGGWYQEVNVTPNTVYLYSAFIRTKQIRNLGVRALVRELGTWFDYWGDIEGDSPDWERILTVFRTSSKPGINLWPAMVSGQGDVWVDEAVLVKIPWNSVHISKLKIAGLEEELGTSRPVMGR